MSKETIIILAECIETRTAAHVVYAFIPSLIWG